MSRHSRVLVGQDEDQAPVYQPTCLDHDRQWFGPQTYDLGTASYNATAHDSNHHQDLP